MTDGIDLTGFNETQAVETNSIDAGYTEAPAAAFPATDMSSQGEAGLNQEGFPEAETSGELV